MSVKRRWTDDQLREAVTASTSYQAVLHRLGLKPGGGSHYDLRHRIRELGLDTSHFDGVPATSVDGNRASRGGRRVRNADDTAREAGPAVDERGPATAPAGAPRARH